MKWPPQAPLGGLGGKKRKDSSLHHHVRNFYDESQWNNDEFVLTGYPANNDDARAADQKTALWKSRSKSTNAGVGYEKKS